MPTETSTKGPRQQDEAKSAAKKPVNRAWRAGFDWGISRSVTVSSGVCNSMIRFEQWEAMWPSKFKKLLQVSRRKSILDFYFTCLAACSNPTKGVELKYRQGEGN